MFRIGKQKRWNFLQRRDAPMKRNYDVTVDHINKSSNQFSMEYQRYSKIS